MTSGYIAVLFISIGQMPFLTTTLDNADADAHFALIILTTLYVNISWWVI